MLTIMDSQWLCSVGGVYGLNMQPVIEAADRLDIETDWIFFRKVKAFEKEALNHLNGKQNGCGEKKKAACREMFGPNLEWACRHCEDKKNE